MYLPSLLYRMLQAALRKVDFESGVTDGILAVERRIDYGLEFCCCHDFVKVGKMFLEMGAKIRCSEGSILHHAAASGSTKIVEYLLSSQVISHCHEALFGAHGVRHAYSPIELAAFHGRTAVVEMLLQVQTSITYHLESDWASAYVIAVEYGRQEIVRTFLEHTNHPRQTQELGCSALHLAKELEHDDIAELISAYGSLAHADFNQYHRIACKTYPRAKAMHVETPQDAIVHTIEARLGKLGLTHGGSMNTETDFSAPDGPDS
jgi:hypothetical protein